MTLAMRYAEEREIGREEDHKLSIEKLAKHYMSENKELTYEEAYEMAKKILK